MKTYVGTSHRVYTDGDAEFAASIDVDNTVKLDVGATADHNGRNATRWLNRGELEQLRGVITRVLSIIP